MKKLIGFDISKLEWHKLYYVLAIIDILTILAALSLTHMLMATYERSVDENKRMSSNVSEIIRLGFIAQSVNEPGNRIFESRDVEAETVAITERAKQFNTALNNASENLQGTFNSEQIFIISQSLVRLDKSMKLMISESHLIFKMVEQDNLTVAGQHMSVMDSYYYQVTQGIGDISQQISNIQNIHFKEQITKARAIKQYEIGISIIVIIIVIFVSIYGHKLGKRLRDKDDAIKDSLAKAHQSAKAKELFLANMSHEIRTPMNAILGMLKLINSSQLSDEDQKYLRLASSSADQLLVIINDILDLSKSENSEYKLENLPFDICGIIDEQVQIHTYANQNKVTQLTSDTKKIRHKVLIGDQCRIKQVISNIISNALKFTKKGQIKLTAETQNVGDKVDLIVTIKDTGIGIASEKLSTIFDVFAQADSSTTRKFGGTGLGLAIAKRICKQMNGDLTVTSELGIGSCFIIKISLKAGSLPKSNKEHQINTQITNFSPLNLHLLVAEDNRVNQILIKKLLHNMGCTFDIACNGQEVLQLLSAKHHAILMDCSMPVMDGYECTKSIRKLNSDLNKIYIIAVTANSMPEDQKKCLAIGMNDYVSKPIEFEKLHFSLNSIAKSSEAIEY